jgi:hypothetical protein
MSVCPKCSNEEPEGIKLCGRCGSTLVQLSLESDETLTISGLNTNDLLKKLEGVQAEESKTVSAGDHPPQAALLLVDTNTVFELSGKTEYSLGRVTEGQAHIPDVDLSTFEAYAQGVSRQHVNVRITQGQIVILDLNSSNGTRINGQKIIPHVEYPVQNGDIIALGKLRLQVIIP